MKVIQIDRSTCRDIRDQLAAHLASLQIEGAKIRIGNASFTNSQVTFKVEVALVSADGVVQTKEGENWSLYAASYGLPKDALGKQVTLNGKVCELMGIAPRSSKYPILAKMIRGGKMYKFQLATVKDALGIPVTPDDYPEPRRRSLADML